MSSKIILLIKIFDKEEYANSFINNGEMFCRTLGAYKRIEGDTERGDLFEGATDWHQPDKVSLTISFKDKNGIEKSFPIQNLAGPLIIQANSFNCLNLYCMYAVKIPKFEKTYRTKDERIKAVKEINKLLKACSKISNEALLLGELAVVIYKVQEFIDKVKVTAKKSDMACSSGLVKYYDSDKFHGSFNGLEAVFHKRDNYQHQKEYRFVFGPHETEADKTIFLGTLNGMAFKLPTKKLNETLKLRLLNKK
ncbi:hypothetical protein [Methylotenera sp. 1P/1]|uniref:hypothetical protein n=1 Tax=Methylotenera sp. 1P/1 TaxID=1131551 RepID=UPI0003635CED|nr:hypothetical protein [Methylotenera sp. 1P/1]